MTFNVQLGSLFDADNTHVLAHCISADYALGLGIARQISNLYRSRLYLENNYKNEKGISPNCLRQRYNGLTIYHLVTKQRYYLKPTYNSLKSSLIKLKEQMISHNEKKLAIPKIACGLDKLDWRKVKEIILEVFDDTDIDITVYMRGSDWC